MWFSLLRGVFYMCVHRKTWSGFGAWCHSSPDIKMLGTYPPPHWNNKGQWFLLVITQPLTRENSQQKRGICGGLFPQSIQLLSNKRLVQYVEGLNVSYSGRPRVGTINKPVRTGYKNVSIMFWECWGFRMTFSGCLFNPPKEACLFYYIQLLILLILHYKYVLLF